MFYSTELLQRRSPLGFVWGAAHGRKLARGRILKVNIGETCEQIMDPLAPQALRLQAILASGIVILHEKQCNFLREDVEHVIRRLNETESNVSKIDLPPQKKRRRKTAPALMDNNNSHAGTDPNILLSLENESLLNIQSGNSCSDLFFLPTLEDEGNIDTQMDGILPLDCEDCQYIIDVPSVPDDVFQLPFQFGEDGCFGKSLTGKVAERDIDMASPASFGQHSIMPPIVVKERSRKRRPLKDSILTMEQLDQFLNSQQNSKEGLQSKRSSCCKNQVNIYDLFKTVPASGELPIALLNLWEDLGHRVRNRMSGKRFISNHQDQFTNDAFDEGDHAFPVGHAIQGEVERLRSALHKTPAGADQNFAFHPLDSKSQGASKSESGASESISGYASDQSRPGKLPRLSDFQDDGGVDFQPVSEDFGLPEGFGASSDLLHMSGASQRGQYPEGMQDFDSHTFGVLSSARLLAKSSSTLLEELTSPLASRVDAARMFHHVLVGVTKGFVRAKQEKPYGSIKVIFDF